MAITKEQWKEISEQLSRPYGRVEIKCGDHDVIFRVEQVKGLKFGIVTYVNKELRGEWVDAESEIGKLFLCRHERFCHGPKARADYIKAMGGKRCPKKYREIAEKKYAYHDILWPSATALRRHYSQLHPNAELLLIGYKPKEGNDSPLDHLKSSLTAMGLYNDETPAKQIG